MSKHLKEVFASRFQVSFLETVSPEPCNVKGTMEIIVEEHNDDGSPWTNQATRFVKICHSHNACIHCEIVIDPQTGIGRTTLQNMEAMKYVVVQVDDCGTQMLNGDLYDITYRVNDEDVEEDYASVTLTQTNPNACIHIVNRRAAKACLNIKKSLRDRNGNPCELHEEMEFLVRITRTDCFEKFVKLNACNDFMVQLEELRAGIYNIEEYEYCDYHAFYKLNGNEEETSTVFEVLPGNNTLEIINEERLDTQLTLQKYVRNNCGELCKPSCFEEFEVSLISDDYEESVVLCEENDFCATLYGLAPGFYDVREIGCSDVNYETSYIVCGGDETSSAQVELCEGSNEEVWVINTNSECNDPCIQDSPLRICKYIRRCDGMICKPEETARFKVMVCGCGMNETFYLNVNNNFCLDLANLCIGEYEIKEVSCGDYITSYSINGGKERTSACVRYDGSENFCVSIINEERNRGSICVSKYIRNEFGDLLKPDKHQCFQVALTSYFCKRCFELNASNDFCMCFHDLRFGSYEIREEELCDYETSYQINCEKERRHARLLVDTGCDNEVKIINSVLRNHCGILKINKFVESNCKELVKPARDEEFEIEVEGPCFCESYILHATNNWCVQLEGLQEGEYQIRECESECYDVTYLVNREIAQAGLVYMGECNQDVTIINRPRRSGSLTISTCVRTCDKDMIKPSMNTAMEVLIEGSDDCVKVCLDASNNWCVTLDELCEGKYRIIQKDNMGYKVSYFIYGREESFGKIRLGSQDEEVMIINEESACMGSVTVRKYWRDEHGDLCMPCPQDEFHFELAGRCFTRTYTLRNRNDFCIFFDDLEEGDYEICELDDGYDVTYRMNGEEVARACFTLGREDIQIDIINVGRSQGMVQIDKRIRKGNALVKPNPEDCFQILLKGKNCHEIYELNCENDFCIRLCDVGKQHYEVKELNANCHVSYDVDGTIQEDGYFLFDDEDIHMTIINEEMLYGCMEISKLIEGENGKLIRPNRYDCFEVMVESDSFKQKIILNKDNNFCERLYNLPQGHYEVNELQQDCCVSYLINDLPYESACVDVCEEDVCITIINHPCAKGTLQFQGMIEENGCQRTPRSEDAFCIRISGHNFCEELILNDANAFCNSLCDLVPDSYILEDMASECTTFEMEGQCYDSGVCIELNGEEVCVKIIRHKENGADITIQKCMVDASGNLFLPEEDACFEVTLTHHECIETYTLNRDNDFTQVLTNQKAGAYEIKESHQHHVLYQIDQRCTQEHGRFEVGKQDVLVNVINKVKANANLHLEARIQDCNGRLIKPCGDMCFIMEVNGEGCHESITLDGCNGWHQKLLLEEGAYHVLQQQDACFCDLYYLVNDQKTKEAIVEICDEDQYVSALNVENCARGSIEICKLMRDEEGCYRYPSKDESFWIRISGDQESERILLNSDNHFYTSLRPLRDGWYEVKEEQGGVDVEYVVNNAAPSSSGKVYVAGNMNTINIINPIQTQPMRGTIELTKYITGDDGVLMKPQSGNYRIHISKPGYNEIFYLNKENAFHTMVDSLEDGLYVVDEVDHAGVTYRINGGSEVDFANVEIRGKHVQVDIINPNEDGDTGSITLAKYIRENNQLRRPNGSESYVFLISRPNYNQLFTLDATNQWMLTIDHLEDGDYVVNETTTTDRVTYIINGGSEVDRAIVSVRGNSNTIQVINASNSSGLGSIHIEKYIREGMKLRRPSGDFKAQLFISKPGYNEVFTLDVNNEWMLDVKNLENGFYVIDEIASNDEVSYIINGGSEVSNGVVQVENDANMVMMIDTMNETSASIQLAKFIRGRDGTLHSPSGSDSFMVEVSGDDNYRNTVTLQASNQWSTNLTDLNNGYYEVREVSNRGYAVSYIVDNGLETNNASVRLLDSAHTVSIINSSGEMMGRLEINKMIKNADGTLIVPADGDIYFVEIMNENTLRRVQLDAGNMFTSVLQDLPQGEYRVREVEGSDYLITYRVNGGVESASANVTMASGVSNRVEVINELRGNRNTIEVFKYMLDNDGNYLPPVVPDVYKFQIRGVNNAINETYDLNVENSWHQSLRTLPSGMYQISEIGTSPYPVKYLINSADLRDEAIFTAQPGSTSVIGIINMLPSDGQGTLVISKRLRDRNGALSLPMNGEVFTVTVSGNNYEQIVTLEPENNYTFTISNIAFGVYLVEEVTNDYVVSYRVNEGIETSTGVVNVDSTAMNVVLVINTENGLVGNTGVSGTNAMSHQNSVVRVVIE